ncbi:uncharacterized protein K460DRAFT_279907 [Cucurbitaria berberidis CBS 394.84]|uniref:Uncharacterized protein n=1 Tax=Cucurbitaria berberidis CBS 394.84 TaxID=1168544 RepID=A0A9P4GNI7_9PLEO|nr:uncharacterized protein K460DRAFT_279907 [Cucurbitaria berberidis CBS 394.84]KAF1848439.1 hypothetical protein K460DRAFT_279907 [Cucurbitaria berberidis CBS 394.84]
MCKYTLYSYECGHPAEDHVDSGTCSEFQRTGVHCDRDNPANKERVKVKNKDRNGICEKCMRNGPDYDEIVTMEREMEQASELSLMEARAREEDMRRVEQRVLEESLAEAERMTVAHEARIKELERESAEEYARKVRQQEEEDFEFIMRKSRADAERAAHEQEMEMIQRAFLESLKTDPSLRNYKDEVITSGSIDLGGGLTEKWIEVKTTSRETLLKQSTAPIAPPPPPPPLPPPPVLVPIAPNFVKKAPRSLPVKKPAPKTVDYTLPAIRDQNIGRFTVGTRHQPTHPSQEIKDKPTSKVPITPSSPAPFARLGGTIAPNIPAIREVRGPNIRVLSAQDAKAGLRRTLGPRKQLPPPDEPYVDPKLKAAMAKRRQWEDEAEDTTSNVSSTSITPSQSASNVPARASTTSSTLSSLSTARRPLPASAESVASPITGATEEAWGEDDAKTMRAKRISKLDFDRNRKTGWGGE